MSGSASATFGHLSVTTDIFWLTLLETLPVSIPGSVGWVVADASVSDMLTVTGGVGDGWLQFFFRGSMGACQGLTYFVGPFGDPWFNGDPLTGCSYGDFDTATGDSAFFPNMHPFVFGTPFLFQMSAQSTSYFNPGDGTLHGDMDVELYRIAVFDADFQPISSFRVVDENGPVDLPEPATFLPAACGIFLLLVQRRNHHNTNKRVRRGS